MGAKELFSRHLVYPLFRTVLPNGKRTAPYFAAGLRARRQQQHWTRPERERWMLGELRALARHAGTKVPFYRERFRAIGFDPRADFSFEDFARIPPLEKDEINAAGDLMLAEGVDRATIFADSTGGSTGQPTKLWKDVAEKGWGLSGVEHLESAVGAGEGRRIVLIWGHHLDRTAKDSWRQSLLQWLTNTEYLDCYRLSPENFAAWHHRLEQARPEVLVCYASAIYLFARWLEEQGLRPRYPSRAIITSAEKLWPHQRESIARVFGAPIHERYGSRDVGLMGFQRDASTPTLAVDSANLLVEPADAGPHGHEASDILVTKLHSFAMPLIRYRVGDVAVFPADARPGHPAHELLDVTGRIMDRVFLPEGASVHAVHFYRIFREFDVHAFQVRQAASGEIDMLYVPGPRFDQGQLARLEHLCQTNLSGATYRLRAVDTIERTRAGKLRAVISEVQAADWQPALAK